jgi:hypothetical protein
LNPDEIMENGLTRAQNEQIEKDAENFRGIMALVCGGLAVYCIFQSLGALASL